MTISLSVLLINKNLLNYILKDVKEMVKEKKLMSAINISKKMAMLL